MGLLDAPDTRSFLGVPWKKLSDEDKAKAAAADVRDKKVKTYVALQEKLDDIQRLQAEIQVAKMDAVQASPGVFALGLGSPGLNLGPEGLAGLAQRGGTDLATAHARLSAWLGGINRRDLSMMSQERQALVQQYVQMEQYLKAVMRDNQLLQEELAYTQSVAQYNHHDFNGAYNDGADPAWEAQLRQQGHHHRGGHVHVHNHGHPQHHVHAPVHGHHVHHQAQVHPHHHGYAPASAPCVTCTPAPVHAVVACTDPYCSGSCGAAPPPAHYGHRGQVYQDPMLSPGFAQARAAQNEHDRWFPPTHF